MGHASITVTAHTYADLDDDELDDVASGAGCACHLGSHRVRRYRERPQCLAVRGCMRSAVPCRPVDPDGTRGLLNFNDHDIGALTRREMY
jgi:hypothetical protein